MADNTQDVKATAPSEASTGEVSSVGGAASAAQDGTAGEKQAFVPFFNEDYEFRSGLGEVGPAYRLAAVFLLMLVAAAMLYMASVWWVERHKAEPAGNSEVVAVSAEPQSEH
jgi:hypothetical protein